MHAISPFKLVSSRLAQLGTLCLVFALAVAGSANAFAQAGGKGKAKGKQAKGTLVDRVVAIVNDEVILSTELMMRVAPMAFELTKIEDNKERKRRQAQLSTQVLDEMVNESLVTQAAKEAKLDVSAKEVQAAINDLKKQNSMDDDGLIEALRLQGYSMASYRKDVRSQILRMRAVNTLVRPRVSITDKDVRAKYDEGVKGAKRISAVHLQHILLGLPGNADATQLKAARNKAAEILAKAKSGTEFGALAGEYSEDPSTKNIGGDLGWIERGTIATDWEEIVFGMAKGETRGPINGPRGLHLFHVSEFKDSKQEAFDKVKDRMKNDMYREELDKQTKLWLEGLRKKAYFELKL